MAEALMEEARLLSALERSVTAAILAQHAMEDTSRYVIECADSDGDGDCPRCNVRTGFVAAGLARGETWRCSRVMEQLRVEALRTLRTAAEEAHGHAHALCVQLDPARYGGGWDGNG